jgi:hypothetical protein
MMSISSEQLSRAIVAYVQKGSAPSPQSDRSAAAAMFDAHDAENGVRDVEKLLGEALDMPVDWHGKSLGDAGREVAAKMGARHPSLSPEALAALAWAFTFAWR